MKNFFKKTIGKTTLFIVCVMLIGMLMAGVLGIFAMIEGDVYTRPQAEVFDELIYSAVRQDCFELFDKAMRSKEENLNEVVPDDGIIFEIRDEKGELLVTSEHAGISTLWNKTFEFSATIDEEGNVFYHNYAFDEGDLPYTFKACLTDSYRESDRYRFISSIVTLGYQLRYLIYPLMLICLIGFVYAFVALMSVSGRRPEEGLYPGPLNKIPFDILCAVTMGAILFVIYVLDVNRFMDDVLGIGTAIVVLLLSVCAILGLCMSLACRIKQKNVIRSSFLYFCFSFAVMIMRFFWKQIGRCFGFLWQFLRQIPLVWKTVLFLCGITFLELILYFNDWHELLFLERTILILLVLYIAIQMRRLQKGGEALATGDLQYRIETKGMLSDLKKHGENLNSVSTGMGIAVEDRLKSERMKTELITNVSHDIKTPLTSIINYAGLISEQKNTNKKTKEYADILVRQSDRLKRLLDDLVEASKASTGNLEVDLLPCDAATFVTQATGEYEEKLQQSDLTLITSVPEKSLTIMADGRRMWRIFDNLMNNICKYALSGTRVYLSLEEIDGKAVFTFKNTSRDALNISEEELMERFTRGDKSRNTEGIGLGLSIARSMAELQNGELKLQIDGDLFKAILSFPLLG